MGQELVNLHRAKKAQQQTRADLPKDDGLNPQERHALDVLRREAEAAGSFLASGGKGGLPPSSVLGKMRKAKYKCEVCHELGAKDTNGGLSMHHKGGIAATVMLSKLGHRNTMKNYEAICDKCHDSAHERARAAGVDSSQVTPAGDKGGSRDKGLPDATPAV